MSRGIQEPLPDSFISAIVDGGEPITTGKSARWALEVIDAIILSAMCKEVVSIPVDRVQYDELMDELKNGQIKVPRIFEDA